MDGYDDIAAQEAQQRRQVSSTPVLDDGYDAMAAQEAEQRQRALKASINVATQTNPAKAGTIQTLADKTGLPGPVIERNEDYVAQQQRMRELYDAVQSSPVLARQMTDPSFAKIAQDDTHNLSAFEQVVRFPWKVTQAVASGLPSLAGGVYGVLAAPFELSAQVTNTGKDALAGRIGNYLREQGSGQAKFAERVADTPADAGLIQRSVMSGFQSLGQNLPTLIGALYTGNAALALSTMAAATGGQSYIKARDAAQSPARSALYGAADAGFEYLTELLPVTKLIGDLKVSTPFLKTLMHNQVAEQLGEQAATVLQDFNEWATLHPEQPFSQYLAERPAAALQTAIATAIGSGGQVAILHAVAARGGVAAESAQDSEAIKQLLQLAGASALRERSPSTFTQFVNAAVADGPVNAVYVNAAQFAQGAAEAGIDIAKAMPETAATIQDAIASNSDVRIPLGEFAAAIPGTTLEQAIIPHLRTSEDGPTQAEASDAAWIKETQAQTEKILAEHDFNAKWKQSLDTVKAELLTQLKQANRFTSDVNDAYAGFMASFYATQAHRLGITPEEMYVRYPLQIRAQGIAGPGTLDQQHPQFKEWFGESKVVDANGQPLVVYHGTNKSFDAFGGERSSKTGNPNAQLGHFFTASPAEASRYAKDWGANGGNVVPVYLSLKSPYQMSYKEFDDLAMAAYRSLTSDPDYNPNATVKFGDVEGQRKAAERVERHEAIAREKALARRNELIAEGYDGIVVKMGAGNEYIAFHPEQIKSAISYNQASKGDDNGQPRRDTHAGSEDYDLLRTVGGGRAEQGWARATRISRGGRPVILYRGAGTPLTAEHFSLESLGHNTGHASSGLGVFFSTSKSVAAVHGDIAPFYLDLRNPYVIEVGTDDAPQFDTVEEWQALAAKLRGEGYDGVVLSTKKVGGGRADVVAFDASQVIYTKQGGTLEQSAKNQIETPEFKAWSNDAPVFAPDEFGSYEGGPAVFEVYHGTTGDFTTFDRDRANTESDLGAGIYFTNEPADVSANYAGEGPDLTQKIELLAEQIAGETDRDYKDPEVIAEAKAQLSVQHGGMVLPVFVHVENPVVIGGHNETVLTYEAKQDEEGEYTGDEEGTLVDFIVALRDVADGYNDGSVDEAIDALLELGIDGSITAAGVINTLKDTEQFGYFTDDNGKLVSNEIVRQAFERAGFDGYVDYTVDTKFGSERMVGKQMAGMNADTVHVVAFEPAQIKSAVGNNGQFDANDPDILHQPARGNITFGQDITQQPSIISLLANADLSTFLHESGHFYLEVLTDMARHPDAPQEFKADLDRVLAWFGVPAEQWAAMSIEEKRPYHEQWARGVEAYLFEGKAPSTELQSLFGRFRAWMLNVYRQLTQLNVTLTDEVRGVMDRLLATNDEITQAENARRMVPLFETKPAGMSDVEWHDYQALGVDATQAAVDQLQTRSLRDMQWLTRARGRALSQLQKDAAGKRKGVRAEVAAEVMRDPLYAAEYGLRHGWVQDDGSTISLKFNTAALAEMYPATNPNSPDLTKLRGMTNAETGIHPDQVAELTGFTSGDELVRKLVEMEPRNQVVEGITDQRMLERYGDLADPASIAKAADEAVHNEARAKFVVSELRALTKATGKRGIITKAAREYAAALIARKRIRDIKPAQYTAAETRAAKAAEQAAGKDDVVTAAAHKRTQIVNIYAAKAAYNAVDEVERAVAYLKRVGDSKTIDIEYREQIAAILERFELRAISSKEERRRASLAQWVESQRDKGFEPVIDEELLNEANRMPYRNMPLEAFRGLVDSVRNIEHLGRLKHKLLTLKDQREFAAVVESLVKSIDDNAKRTLPVQLERNTWLDKMKSGTAEFFAMHRKFSMMAREMDGHIDNGTMWNLLVRPMNEAGDNESVMREAATIKLSKLFEPLLKAGKLREKTFIPEIKGSLSREGRIMVALNTGNEGNLQRLMDGDHWTMAQVQAVVDTLTKDEMNFVQGVWDFVGSYRTEIGQQQKRLTGVEPEWVDARKVITPHGEYAGGYLPAKYDTTRSTRSLADEAAAGIMDQWRGKRGISKARDSFTKARASKVVDRPLRKDFGVITQHVTEVTHRLAWQEFLTDATRLLRASAVDNAIRDHYGPEVLKALRDTIEDVAAGEVGAQNSFERGVNYLRTGATIAGLGWRLTTSLLQPIGLTQSMVRIGSKHVMKGLGEWLGDAAKMENTAKRIYEKSDMMRLRAKTMQREISEIRNQVSGRSSAIEASYFYLIQKMQLVADIPTWLGQYHKAVDNGADEKGAIAQADQAVLDAQGGGQIKDLAAIQRGGPLLKLFTNFYSFFNTTYNLTSEAVGRTNFKSPLSVGLLAVDMLLLYSVPAALGTLLKAALHSGDDDQDLKKLIRQLIADQLTYLFGTMVGLREVAGGLQTTLGLPGDYQGPASVRVFAEIAKLGKQIGQGEVDEALLKAANNVAGILFHYPAGQINATADGIVTMAQGKTQNPGALVVGSNKK